VLRFKLFRRREREFVGAFESMKLPMAAAGSAAISEAAEIVKREARADIAAAGFSARWQNALRANVYPRPPRVSMNAAAIIWHKIQYAGVFEEGPTTIVGKPMLWLPLGTTPSRVNRRRMTPALYVRTIGPLFSINRPGKRPLLAAQIATDRRGQRAGNKGKVTLSALRRGSAGAPSKLVPLFIGIDRVTLRDRFSIREITERAAARLGALYLKHLNPEN
jgi:Family of unknown function (DUF6441)